MENFFVSLSVTRFQYVLLITGKNYYLPMTTLRENCESQSTFNFWGSDLLLFSLDYKQILKISVFNTCLGVYRKHEFIIFFPFVLIKSKQERGEKFHRLVNQSIVDQQQYEFFFLFDA